jgi:hypothetical protein
MKQLPILFSTEMVRVILEKRKTQTRRVVKIDLSNLDTDVHDPDYLYLENEHGEINHLLFYAPVQKGDFLYVRETFCIGEYVFHDDIVNDSYFIDQLSENTDIIYKADIAFDNNYCEDPDMKVIWKPSIFLPKKDSRIWLKVTDVRVEKLQSISGEDVYNEGIKSADVSDYADLWDSLNEKRGYGWDKNPYVWVYEFEVSKNT